MLRMELSDPAFSPVHLGLGSVTSAMVESHRLRCLGVGEAFQSCGAAPSLALGGCFHQSLALSSPPTMCADPAISWFWHPSFAQSMGFGVCVGGEVDLNQFTLLVA